MAVQPFKRQQVADKDLQLVQDNVANALTQLQAMPMVGGNVVTHSIGTSQTSVAHGLGRVAQYYISLGQGANATFWQSASPDRNYLYLTASSPVTVTLWVN